MMKPIFYGAVRGMIISKKRQADGWQVELIRFLESLAGYCMIAIRIH